MVLGWFRVHTHASVSYSRVGGGGAEPEVEPGPLLCTLSMGPECTRNTYRRAFHGSGFHGEEMNRRTSAMILS